MNDQTTSQTTLSRTLVYLVFFACTSCLLAFCNWESINAINIEVGDFAANSLLIQDAKSFNLWVGNYSRVGFNHPGPAILLVLAAGESFFYDFIHAVPSPFSGQLLAVSLYNAIWITLAFGAFSKILQSKQIAAIAISAALISFSFFDFQIFNGIWFPHLYVLPFLVMLLAASRLAGGHTDLMKSLAISAGFLINGHVSFVAILGIIFICVLASNWCSFHKTNTEKTILNKSFLVKNTLPLLNAVGLLLIFFVPLIIQTIIEFPGPVASYAAFSGGHKPNSFMEAVRFTAEYWGGTGYFITAMLIIIIMPRIAKIGSPAIYESVRSFSYTIIGATAALLFYAKFGVDLLDQKYIGLFYYSGPALTISFALVTALIMVKFPFKYNAWIFVIIATTFILTQQIKRPAAYAALYKKPQAVELYDKIEALRTEKNLVLDLDNAGDWGNVWSSILGIQAYAKRKHETVFCIRKNWHISFTKVSRCTDEQSLSGQRLFVSSEKQESKYYGEPILQGMGLFFYEPVTPKMGPGNYSLAENHALYRQFFLVSGWSNVENDFVWSEGKESHIQILLQNSRPTELSIELGAFLPSSSYVQNLSIYLNNELVTDIAISQMVPKATVNIPVNGLSTKSVDIKLVLHNPTSPRAVGMSADGRILGVSLYGIQIKEIQQ